MKKTLIVLVSLLLTFTLTGAGCDKTSTITSTDSDATVEESSNISELNSCNYLSKDIALKYLGETNEPTLNNTAGVVSTCSYNNPETFAAITLLVRRSQGDAEAAVVNANAKAESKNLSGVDAEDVPGLGDSAYWAGGNLNQLNVFRGADWLILSAFGADFNKDKAIELMIEILKN